MLLSNTSFLCSPISFSLPKRLKTSSIPLFPNHHHHQNNNRFTSYKTNVLYNGYSYFTSPCHPLQLELPNDLQANDEPNDDHNAGLGIISFYQGKNIFLTGATGLLGKVLLEKILRSTPVGKVYLLIKAKDNEDACDRLSNEIINSDLFECLRKKHGESYEAFMKEKLIPIVGNICETNLGMDSDSAHTVQRDVDIIIQSAASTTLNERYDVLMDANMNAPQRLMRFAKACKNLKLFAHISTAYVNGRREGLMLEEPLTMGDDRRKQEKHETISSTLPRLDVAEEINMALKYCSAASTDYDVTKTLKKLGQERATHFGWYNTYHLTKAMGEMVLDEIRGDVPVVIIRPTVIESIFKEPFPGWIQGNRMFDPVIISYGKGQLPAFLGNPEVIMDIIPVDMVANTTIAAMAKEGSLHKPNLNVYHVASSDVNPLRYSDFFEYLYEHFNSTPLVESRNIDRIKYFDNFDEFSRYTREAINSGHTITNRCKAKVAYAEQLCKMYEFIGFFNARFNTGNTERLIKEMSKEELIEFEINAMSIDWREYVQDVHIPGLKKHILNGTRTSV
ncbi:hypothetical protein CASFOL_036508 [Castilleja foliolosa]|uniref:Fatty acyl-CoA reductase n=1 Tax=Castilleja foliolosa TaxID=1961234 RepID=A0ABD3BXC7_9LAMI